MIRNAIALPVIGFLVCSCANTRTVDVKIKDKLISVIREECRDTSSSNTGLHNECVINLNTVIDGTWKETYVFSPAATNEEINEAIGSKIAASDKITRKVVVRGDNEVLRYEEFNANLEEFVDHDVVFDDIDPITHHAVFDRDSAFQVEVNTNKNGTFYRLKCVNCR